MSTDELTPAEVKAIAAEIDAWNAKAADATHWKIFVIQHLYALPVECYLVWYENTVRQVFSREEDGKLRPAYTMTYRAPDYDRTQQKEEASYDRTQQKEEAS